MIFVNLYIRYRIMDEQIENINSEDEDFLREEEDSQYLQDNFTFQDFWNYKPTQDILKNEFIQEFYDTVGKEITEFYLKERDHCVSNLSNLFAFDVDGTKAWILESLVYNHIEKEYDLELFYNNPCWATSFVHYHLENDKKNVKKEITIPKKSLRQFNWATKTYTNS